MQQDEISQIMINGRLVGIVGLDAAIKSVVQASRSKTDADIEQDLLTALSPNNYIPATMRDTYGHAFLREFKKAQGFSTDPEPVPGLSIIVLGLGCARCSQLESDVRDILSEMQIAADLRHIDDLKEIARYEVLGSPALIINNKTMSVGEVPPKSKIRQWIVEAYPTAEKKK